MKKVITLLTDFGLKDSYIGAMKGVILSINPEVHIIDITHDIEPQSILDAAFVLYTTYSYFPKGTIHLAVVDPGVGTERRPIGITTQDYYFIGPDNGVFGLVLGKHRDSEVFQLINNTYFREKISQTFHGRDIFAPVAAHLSLGVTLDKIGRVIKDYKGIEIPEPLVTQGLLEGQIIYRDRFGNLVTNVSQEIFSHFVGHDSFEIEVGPFKTQTLRSAYAEVAPGEPLAIFGSTGYLEISENMGNASARLGLDVGDPIRIRKIMINVKNPKPK